MYWGDKEVGRSVVVENSSEPAFGARVVVPDVSDWGRSALTFRLWDHAKAASDTLVGEFEVPGGFLLHLKAVGAETFPFRASKDDDRSDPAGFLEARLALQVCELALPAPSGLAPAPGARPDAAAFGPLGTKGSILGGLFGGSAGAERAAAPSLLRLDIVGARGLFAADDNGLSDPYCVVYWEDEEASIFRFVYNYFSFFFF